MRGASGRENRTASRVYGSTGVRCLLRAACVLFLLTGGLAGCDLLPTTPETIPPTPEPTDAIGPAPTGAPRPGVTSLVFWEPYALDRPQGLLLGEMIRDFEGENPDIVVEIIPKAGYVGIHSAMLAALPGGELPHLSVAFPSMIAEYAEAGVVAPLDPYLNDLEIGLSEEDVGDILPTYLDAGRFPGYGRQILAFPFVQNVIGMWVNETLLAEAGWDHAPATWAEFEQACFDVVASTGVGCYPFVESVSTFNAWLYSHGGQQLDVAGRQALFNGPAGVESMALLRRLMDAGVAWRPEEPYGDYVAFTNGEAAFTFSSTGNGLLYADAYEAAIQRGVPPFRWRQTLIPQADQAQPATLLYGASFFVISGDPAHEEAAWRLIRWFSDTNQTARWAGGMETMPLRVSALEVMTETLEAYPFVQAQVEEILPYAQPEPAVAVGLEVRDILYTAILSITQGYADPQTALDQAAQDTNAILAGQR
jgi:ABC-type glycerol-3-phosphate transport system substrate-binding protein